MTRWTRYEWNDDSMRFIHASWNGRLSFTYDENNNRTSAVRETYKYYNQTWEYDGWNLNWYGRMMIMIMLLSLNLLRGIAI